MSRRILAVIAAVGLVGPLVLMGCAKRADVAARNSGVILIGEYDAFHGRTADFGKTTHEGIVLAVDEINGKGLLLGKRVVLKSEDDRGEASEARTAVQKLIDRDGVVAVLGEVASSNTLTAAPVAQSSKIPLITPSSTNPDVTKIGNYIFRVCFTDDFQGAVCATFARDSLKAARSAIFRDVTSDYSKGFARAFESTFQKKGGGIVARSTYTQGDKDFKSQLTAIRSANPDIIFVPGYYGEVSLIAVQARDLGIRVPLLGGDGWDSTSLVPAAGTALEGCYFSTHFSSLDTKPEVARFVKAFRKRYGHDPNALAALGYDAAWILAEAIRRAGSTQGDAIRRQLAATKDFPGVTGRITIDSQRNASKPAVILQIRGTSFVSVASITPRQVK